MSLPLRWCAVGLGLVSVVLLGTIPLAAQQETPAKAAGKSGDARKPSDPSRRVPPLFGELGLSAEQKEAMYKIRAQHQARLDELKKQVLETNAKIVEECEALLSAPQKELLVVRRKVSADAARARLAATKEKAAARKRAAAAKEKEAGKNQEAPR